MKKGKQIKFAILFMIVILISSVYICVQSEKLVNTEYEISTNLQSPLKVIHLTDLHNECFGNDNKNLVDRISEESPDIIFMTGDMINAGEEDLSVIKSLLTQLINVAPIYYGYGNHEYRWEKDWARNIKSELLETGVVVVNNDYVDVEIGGNQIRIGGYMGYYRQPGMFYESQEQVEAELDFADDFENTNRYKILLNHIPTQWVDWNYIDTCSVDLVLSGHYHGGVIYFPLINRGLYAPYIGLFPKNVRGIFKGDKGTCVLSAGLGSEYLIPRINNNPEMVIIDLIPEG